MDIIGDGVAYLAGRAKVAPSGEWLARSQVLITRLKEARFPTRAKLATAARHHPVAFHTGPVVMVGRLALVRSGLDRNFQLKGEKEGSLEKDAHGEPALRGNWIFGGERCTRSWMIFCPTQPPRKPRSELPADSLQIS